MIQEKLATYIGDMGIKQKTLAEKCGMSEMAVSAAMRGERRVTLDEYAAICGFLHVSMDFFNDTEDGA
ncbi:helix-turn-helix transcriptional regulator [Paratractidigestivibacter sp.]|uniref:helix-turn-helix domain-containing protein n=1 Tax=Paratractidigestivibacter sp. TaxID=2847316 RepID=UPI002ABD8622|nr:helix-turn-helix transcriptional regulator [Paratractidigestivibacter sp.]